MSLNTSHTPDGLGILIYNGEMILLYTTNVKLKFEKYNHPLFKSTKSGALYLTSHRIIFMNDSKKDEFKSFAMPFHSVRDVKLEQPLLTPNYLKGWVEPLPGGNFEGNPEWRLSFPKGGCIEFGESLLRAADMASRARPFAAPPAYGAGNMPQQSTATYYAAPQNYYLVQGTYQGFQAPTNVFPERPPAQNVYVYDIPPPYPGIGQTTPYPAGQFQTVGTVPYQNVAPYPNSASGDAIRPGQPQYQPYPNQPYPNQPPAAGFAVGQGAAPSGPPQYQQLQQQQPNAQPPAYSAYQEAPPLPSKNGPL
uniref:GRAM domain-containing protein n=1 Tax=Caenorhabditis japonica TaxID=281687 RepID=A0A8R1DSH9_CAEJA